MLVWQKHFYSVIRVRLLLAIGKLKGKSPQKEGISYMNTIEENLNDFISKVNSTPRLGSLLKNWQRIFNIDIHGDQEYHILFNENNAKMISSPSDYTFPALSLKADKEKANEVFSGQITPMEAYLDGELEVEATDEDQTKLDAISLVIWGD